MLTGLRRVVKSGFVGFWRSAYVSLSSVFVLTVSLFVIGSTMFLDQLLVHSLQTLQSRVDLNVYFMPDATEEEIEQVTRTIEALPDVQSVTFTSREEAIARYRADNFDDETSLQALEELNDNPLGASLAVLAQNASQYEQIARFIEELQAAEPPTDPVIDEYNYKDIKGSIERLNAIINATERAALFVMVILLIASVLITFNTIRLAIYTAREEISIMRLVGASNMFIRGPFMLQGIMYGFISAILVCLILYPIMLWLGPATEYFDGFNVLTYYSDNFLHIFLVLAGIGVTLGLVSSALAIARYLKV